MPGVDDGVPYGADDGPIACDRRAPLGEQDVAVDADDDDFEEYRRDECPVPLYLPEDDEVMLRTQDLGAFFQRVRPLAEERVFFLQRLIMRCILQFQGSRSVDQANSLLNSSLELFQHELDLKYAMLRYLVWVIPTLGFIGTIVGIAFSLDYAANVEDPQDPTLLAEITGRLGVAFYTTLLALLQSVLLVFALHIAQSREEMALNQAGQYCLDNLINRLYEN